MFISAAVAWLALTALVLPRAGGPNWSDGWLPAEMAASHPWWSHAAVTSLLLSLYVVLWLLCHTAGRVAELVGGGEGWRGSLDAIPALHAKGGDETTRRLAITVLAAGALVAALDVGLANHKPWLLAACLISMWSAAQTLRPFTLEELFHVVILGDPIPPWLAGGTAVRVDANNGWNGQRWDGNGGPTATSPFPGNTGNDIPPEQPAGQGADDASDEEETPHRHAPTGAPHSQPPT